MSSVQSVGWRAVDFSGRLYVSNTIIGSPAANGETAIATTPVVDGTLEYAKALVDATVAYTIGTSGSACTVQIRQGSGTAGASIFTTGAQTGGHNTAGLLVSDEVSTYDLAPAPQYTITLQITAGAGASTVSKVAITVLYL